MFFPLEWSDTLRFGIVVLCLWTVCALAWAPEPPLLTLNTLIALMFPGYDSLIDIEKHKLIAQINYLLPGTEKIEEHP